jgi:hypothetical protein
MPPKAKPRPKRAAASPTKPKPSPSKPKTSPTKTTPTKRKVTPPKPKTTAASKRKASPRTNRKKASPKKNKKNTAPATVTPNPGGKSKFHLYILRNGKQRTFDNEDDAQEFFQEYENIVVTKEAFATKAKLNAYVKQCVVTTPQKDTGPEVIAIDEDMSPSDKASFNRIRTLIDDSKPTAAFVWYWKTTKKCGSVIIIFRPEDIKGDDMWMIKQPLDTVMRYYFKENPTEIEQVNEFFANMKLAKQRDSDKGNTDAKVTVRESDKKEFPHKVMWTHFTIPVQTLSSAEEEQNYIEATLQHATMAIRSAQRGPLFMKLVQSQFSEKMYRAMTKSDTYNGSFQDFMQKAKLKIKRCENLNTHVVQEEANDMKMFLFDKEFPDKKYPTDDLYKDQKERQKQNEANVRKPGAKQAPKQPKVKVEPPPPDTEDEEEDSDDESTTTVTADNHVTTANNTDTAEED